MKKEKDEITDLFRTRLANAEMEVRDGFWETLSQDVSTLHLRRRRLLIVRMAAAASVLLVLAASSAAVWYFFPKEELGEALTQIEVSHRRGTMDGDGVRLTPLPPLASPMSPAPSPKPCGTLTLSDDEEDSLSVTVAMSFSFSATTTVTNGAYPSQRYRHNGYWQASHAQPTHDLVREEPPTANKPIRKETGREYDWAVKFQAGAALPAEGRTYKAPFSAGVTVERKLGKRLGMETGVLYSYLHSEGMSLHYLGIPLKMNVTLADTKKVDIYATFGGIADKCVSGAPNNNFEEEPIQLAVVAGVGMNYKINNRLALFAEPVVSRHFKTESKIETVRTKRPANFNLLCGIRMTY